MFSIVFLITIGITIVCCFNSTPSTTDNSSTKVEYGLGYILYLLLIFYITFCSVSSFCVLFAISFHFSVVTIRFDITAHTWISTSSSVLVGPGGKGRYDLESVSAIRIIFLVCRSSPNHISGFLASVSTIWEVHHLMACCLWQFMVYDLFQLLLTCIIHDYETVHSQTQHRVVPFQSLHSLFTLTQCSRSKSNGHPVSIKLLQHHCTNATLPRVSRYFDWFSVVLKL